MLISKLLEGVIMSVSSATTTVNTEIAKYNKASSFPSQGTFDIMGRAVKTICEAIERLGPDNKQVAAELASKVLENCHPEGFCKARGYTGELTKLQNWSSSHGQTAEKVEISRDRGTKRAAPSETEALEEPSKKQKLEHAQSPTVAAKRSRPKPTKFQAPGARKEEAKPMDRTEEKEEKPKAKASGPVSSTSGAGALSKEETGSLVKDAISAFGTYIRTEKDSRDPRPVMSTIAKACKALVELARSGNVKEAGQQAESLVKRIVDQVIGFAPELESPPEKERDWDSRVKGDTGKVKELLQKLCKNDPEAAANLDKVFTMRSQKIEGDFHALRTELEKRQRKI